MAVTLDAKLPKALGPRTTYHVATSDTGGLNVWSTHGAFGLWNPVLLVYTRCICIGNCCAPFIHSQLFRGTIKRCAADKAAASAEKSRPVQTVTSLGHASCSDGCLSVWGNV